MRKPDSDSKLNGRVVKRLFKYLYLYLMPVLQSALAREELLGITVATETHARQEAEGEWLWSAQLRTRPLTSPVTSPKGGKKRL